MEKNVYVACHLLRFLLDAALNRKKELGKKNRANVAVPRNPQHISVLKKLKNAYILRFLNAGSN